MRLILSLFTLALLASPALSHGYGAPQQAFIPKQQFAPPVYAAPVQQQAFYQKQTVIRQQQFAAPVYAAPVQQAYCPPAAAFAPPVYAAPPAAFIPARAPRGGLFGGGRNVFRQRTFFRGQAGGVQAQFGAY